MCEGRFREAVSDEPGASLKLIIGLGEPGPQYQDCRSNIGFKVLDIIASNLGIHIKTKKKKTLLGYGKFDNEDVVLLKPQTYAELSGEAALYIASFLHVKPKDIIVIFDDFTRPFGQISIFQNGDMSGHPAMEDLQSSLKSTEFVRIHVGVRGESLNGQSRKEYIHQEFEIEETEEIIRIINDVEAAIRMAIMGEIDEVIHHFNLQ